MKFIWNLKKVTNYYSTKNQIGKFLLFFERTVGRPTSLLDNQENTTIRRLSTLANTNKNQLKENYKQSPKLQFTTLDLNATLNKLKMKVGKIGNKKDFKKIERMLLSNQNNIDKCVNFLKEQEQKLRQKSLLKKGNDEYLYIKEEYSVWVDLAKYITITFGVYALLLKVKNEKVKIKEKIEVIKQKVISEDYINYFLDKLNILEVYPRLYLTNKLTKEEKDKFFENMENLEMVKNQLDDCSRSIEYLKNKIGPISGFITSAKRDIAHVDSNNIIFLKELISIAYKLNEAAYLHKTHNYALSFNKVNEVFKAIENMENAKEEYSINYEDPFSFYDEKLIIQTSYIFEDKKASVNKIKCAAYNIKAKVNRCLFEADKKNYKLGDSLDCYNKAIELDKNCAALHSSRAYLLEDMYKYNLKERKDENYSESWETLLTKNSDNAIILAGLGSCLYQTEIENIKNNQSLNINKLDKAYGLLSKAIGIDPNLANIYVERGSLSYMLGRYDEAERDFKEALRIDKNHLIGNYSTMKVLLKQGETSDKKNEKNKSKTSEAEQYKEKYLTLSANKREESISLTTQPLDFKQDVTIVGNDGLLFLKSIKSPLSVNLEFDREEYQLSLEEKSSSILQM